MTTRRGLFVAPFDALADPRVVGDLAADAEAAGWEGLCMSRFYTRRRTFSA